jgi:hypothetical protein
MDAWRFCKATVWSGVKVISPGSANGRRVHVVTPRCGSATGLGFKFAWSERGL